MNSYKASTAHCCVLTVVRRGLTNINSFTHGGMNIITVLNSYQRRGYVLIFVDQI